MIALAQFACPRDCIGADFNDARSPISTRDTVGDSFLDNEASAVRVTSRLVGRMQARGRIELFTALTREWHLRHASCLSRHRVGSEPMNRSNPAAISASERQTGSFVVVSLDQVKHGITQIRSVLESIGIAVEVVESGRRLRWSTAVVLRIPEPQVAEAMLALGMNGFGDVVAYQSSDAVARGEAHGSPVKMTGNSQGGTERC